jgi:hypothetical protein
LEYEEAAGAARFCLLQTRKNSYIFTCKGPFNEQHHRHHVGTLSYPSLYQRQKVNRAALPTEDYNTDAPPTSV